VGGVERRVLSAKIKKRRRNPSKEKGSAYERAIAAILSSSFYSGGDGTFQRIQSQPIPAKGQKSADVEALRYMEVDGEQVLICDRSWPFSIECKNIRKAKHFFSGLYEKDFEIVSWASQAALVAARDGKVPLLIVRLFRSKDLAVLRAEDYARMAEYFGKPKGRRMELRSIGDEERAFSFVFLLLEDFLDWVDWEFYKVARFGRYIKSLIPEEES
jgi:hypothetical protein